MTRLRCWPRSGAVLFTLAWAVLGAVSPGYRLFDRVIEPQSPISQPISGLGLGVTALCMNTTFIVCGLLVIAGAIGVRRTLPPTRLAPRLSAVLLVSGPLTLGLFAWFMAIFDPYSAGANAGYAGMAQRAAITVVAAAWTILGITTWRRIRDPRQGVRPSPAPGAGR